MTFNAINAPRSMGPVTVFLALSVASIARAQNIESTPTPRYMEPCTLWRLDSSSFDYVCSRIGRDVDYYDAAAVDELVGRLEARIKDLELRVEALEVE